MCCRIAGLAVVDRLKTEVITAAITHYQHIALLQARRHIIKRVINRNRMKHPDQVKVGTLMLVKRSSHNNNNNNDNDNVNINKLTVLSAAAAGILSNVSTSQQPDESTSMAGKICYCDSWLFSFLIFPPTRNRTHLSFLSLSSAA